MVVGNCDVGLFKMIIREKLTSIRYRNESSADYEPNDSDRRKRYSKFAIGNTGEASNENVLRISGDGCDTAYVGRGRCRQQIGNGISLQPSYKFKDQRRHY